MPLLSATEFVSLCLFSENNEAPSKADLLQVAIRIDCQGTLCAQFLLERQDAEQIFIEFYVRPVHTIKRLFSVLQKERIDRTLINNEQNFFFKFSKLFDTRNS